MFGINIALSSLNVSGFGVIKLCWQKPEWSLQ